MRGKKVEDYTNFEALFELESFEAGGRKLWEGLHDEKDPDDVEALVFESCRVKDRLDRLHKLQRSDSIEWGRVIATDIEGEYVLKMGGVLRELRQTEIVFKQLLAEIHRRRALYDDDDLAEEGGLSDL